jgi:hypothetical protein
MRLALGALGVVAGALGVGACSDAADPAGPTNALGPAEAQVMMEALVQAGGSLFLAPPTGPGGSPGAPSSVPFSDGFDTTVSCPVAGQLRVSGTVSGDVNPEGDGTVSLQVRQVHDGCTATASSDGSTWTFDGNPDVQLGLEWTTSGTDVALSGSQVGGIAWSSGDRSGTCAIDLSYGFDVDPAAQAASGSIRGTVCGYAVAEDVDAF